MTSGSKHLLNNSWVFMLLSHWSFHWIWQRLQREPNFFSLLSSIFMQKLTQKWSWLILAGRMQHFNFKKATVNSYSSCEYHQYDHQFNKTTTWSTYWNIRFTSTWLFEIWGQFFQNYDHTNITDIVSVTFPKPQKRLQTKQTYKSSRQNSLGH